MTNEQRIMVSRLRADGMGYTAVARETGLSRNTVKTFCRRNGLTGFRSANGESSASVCRECGRAIKQTEKVKTRVFCSKECRVKWWKEHPEMLRKKAVYSYQCAYCGKPFTAYGNNHRKYCSRACYVAARFKGGAEDG